MTDFARQRGNAEALALAVQLGTLPDAPLAMPKQRIENGHWGIARLFKGIAALPRLLADDRGR
jgi:hypothetical protein